MDILYLIIFFILGTIIGKYSTIIGLRLPKGEKLSNPLHCDSCSHELKRRETIPLISYIIQKGRCNYCHSKIDILMPYMEFFCGLLFAVSYYSFNFSYDTLLALGLITLLMIITVSDITYLIINDEVLIAFTIYFLVIDILKLGIRGMLTPILSAVILFAVMYSIMLIGNKVFKKESLGGGDIKLMFVLGLLLEPLLGALTVFVGSLLALPVSYLLMKKNKDKLIPFGPFLMIAACLIFFMKITTPMVISWLGF